MPNAVFISIEPNEWNSKVLTTLRASSKRAIELRNYEGASAYLILPLLWWRYDGPHSKKDSLHCDKVRRGKLIRTLRPEDPYFRRKEYHFPQKTVSKIDEPPAIEVRFLQCLIFL